MEVMLCAFFSVYFALFNLIYKSYPLVAWPATLLAIALWAWITNGWERRTW